MLHKEEVSPELSRVASVQQELACISLVVSLVLWLVPVLHTGALIFLYSYVLLNA